MEENWSLPSWGESFRARAVSISAGARRGTGRLEHTIPAQRGCQAARLAVSGRRLSARRCEGSGVDRAAGQYDEGNQGTVPPRGNRQANLAWLSLVHRTRPDQTLCSRSLRRQRGQRRGLRVVLKSGPSAVRTPRICELLYIFGLVLSALPDFLIQKFHPGDGAMPESTPTNHKSLIGFARLMDVGSPCV